MRTLVLLGLLSWPAAAEDYPLPPPPASSTSSVRLDFSAEQLDYEEASSMFHLKGGVKVRESTWTIKAQELWIDSRRQLGRSEGDLLVEDGVSALYGDFGEFDFGKQAGTLYRASAGHGDWRIHAKRLEVRGRRLDYYGANFTSCSFDPKPHYHFRASRITVVPKKYLLARHSVFYLGKVPLLYTPFLYKSLKPTHFLPFKVQPGYDRRNGGFLKSTLTTEHGPHLYSKLFIDYYGSQGLGTGAELQRRKGEDSRGSLYGYRIRETHNSRERWTMLGNGYQALSSSMAFQGRLQVQSDADFNNHYARSLLLRVTPELINSAALVYRLPQATARLSYSRLDVASDDKNRFLKSKESAPRLDFQTAPFGIWRLPWLNTFDSFAENAFDRDRTFIEKSVGAGWEGTKTVPVARGVSLTPKFGYRQAYLNRVDSAADFSSTSTVRDAFVGRYSAGANLRFATAAGDWDAGYRHARRHKADTMVDDAGAPDHGVEASLATLQNAFRPNRRVLLRASSGYDFRVFRDRSVGFRERVQPIVADVIYMPRPALNISVRNDYQLGSGNRSFLLNAQYGELDGRFLGLGVGHGAGAADRYYLNTEFGWVPSTGTWSLRGALRSEAATSGGAGRLSRFHLFEKELSVAKSWHDFFTRVLVRFRPGGVREINARLDLKFGGPPKEGAPRRDWEAEWFPERGAGGVERP